MKQPKCGYDSDEFENECYECDEPWPCKKWRRWTASKDYRIAELEATLERALVRIAATESRLNQLEDKAYHVETWVKGVTPAFGDLLAGKAGGSISISSDTEYQDFSSAAHASTFRLTRGRLYSVTYNSPDGSVYKNGRCIERTIRNQ
jgi:hypothetical protein